MYLVLSAYLYITRINQNLRYHKTSTVVLYHSISTGDESEKNEMGGHVARKGECRDIYRFVVLKSEGGRPLGRPRCRWEDNIKMDLQEIVCGVRTGSSWLRIWIDGGHL